MNSKKKGLHNGTGIFNSPLSIFLFLFCLLFFGYCLYTNNLTNSELKGVRKRLNSAYSSLRQQQSKNTELKAQLEKHLMEEKKLIEEKNQVEMKQKENSIKLLQLNKGVQQLTEDLEKAKTDSRTAESEVASWIEKLNNCKVNVTAMLKYGVEQEAVIIGLRKDQRNESHTSAIPQSKNNNNSSNMNKFEGKLFLVADKNSSRSADVENNQEIVEKDNNFLDVQSFASQHTNLTETISTKLNLQNILGMNKRGQNYQRENSQIRDKNLPENVKAEE